MKTRRITWLNAAVCMAAAGTAAAGDDPAVPGMPSVEVPVMRSSGWMSAAGPARAEAEVVYETVVGVPGAPWVRLVFASSPETVLAGDPAASNAGEIRITSLSDGAVQRLNAEHLGFWGHTSAYFNGDAVRVELLTPAGTGGRGSRVVIMTVIAGREEAVSDRSICQSVDNRELSNDPRAGRLMPSVCTAWLFNDMNSTFLTAGHCSAGASNSVQFNTPLSSSSGGAVNSAPEDQYPVDGASTQGTGGGTGNDWRNFGCFPNSNTGLTPYQRQQARYTLAAAAPAADNRAIRITGYGTTSSPVPNTWSRTQKTHVGEYRSMSGNLIRYHVDTTGGNSGSAVLDEENNLAIGIHTHAGCNTSATSSNQGTAIHHPGLQGGLANPRGVCASGRGAVTPGLYVGGDLNNNFGTLNRATGNFARVSQAGAGVNSLAYDVDAGVFRGVDRNRNLITLNAENGEMAPVTTALSGVAGDISGLAYDEVTGTLFGIVQATGQLVRVDAVSGVVSAVGSPQGGNIGALEYDPSSGGLYGIDDIATGSRLVWIDKTTGARTVIGVLATNVVDCNGLAWSEQDGWLYTINAGNEQLMRMNRWTGQAQPAGPTGGSFGAAFGMAAARPAHSRCAGDFNGVGGATYDDLLDYLSAWFRGHPAAERDGLAPLTDKDIFEFLGDWLGGC